MTGTVAVPAHALDQISEASLITDLNQLIVYANAAFTSITGYSQAEVLGTNCRFLQDEYTDPRAIESMTLARMSDATYQGDVLNRRKDGSHFWNSLTILPMRDRYGRTTHYMSVQRDLSPKAVPVLLAGLRTSVAPVTAAATVYDAKRRAHQRHRQALADGGLTLFMQPFVNLHTGAVVVVECLARLRLETGEIVTAGEFLPSLTNTEIDELFRFGLEQACDAMAEWDAAGLTLDVSVNLDPSTLRNPLCAGWVRDALERHSVSPSRLILELLETRSTDSEIQRSSITALRALGIRLAIDDLGSGFSNLSRLSAIDFDLFKIDAENLAGLYRRPLETLSLFAALIQLSLDLDRDAVVEGIEDANMAGVAAILGAGIGQGYLFAKPMPRADIAEWATTFMATPKPEFDAVAGFATALAFHFRYRRLPAHPGPLEECPLTPFLLGQQVPADIMHAHEALHLPQDSGDPGGDLLAWLVDRVESATVG